MQKLLYIVKFTKTKYTLKKIPHTKEKIIICNYTFYEECENVIQIKYLSQNIECNFSQMRAPLIVLKLSNRDDDEDYFKYESPTSIVISQKKCGTRYNIKYIGCNNFWKVAYASQKLYEFFCEVITPQTGKCLYWGNGNNKKMKFKNLTLVNSILKWGPIGIKKDGTKILCDFNKMAREGKSLIQYLVSLFPQLIFQSSNMDCDNMKYKFTANISYRGIITASFIKTIDDVDKMIKLINYILESMNHGNEKNLYIYGKEEFKQYYSEAKHNIRQYYNTIFDKNGNPEKAKFCVSRLNHHSDRVRNDISSDYLIKDTYYPSICFYNINVRNFLLLYKGCYMQLFNFLELKKKLFTIEEMFE